MSDRYKWAFAYLMLALALTALVELPIHFLRSRRTALQAVVVTNAAATYQVFYAKDEHGFDEANSARSNTSAIDIELEDTPFIRLDFEAASGSDFSFLAPTISDDTPQREVLETLRPRQCHDCEFTIADGRIAVHTTGDDAFLLFERSSSADRHVSNVEQFIIFSIAFVLVFFARRWLIVLNVATLASQYAVIATVFAMAFVIVTPPLQGPDESNHFARAFSLSYGHIRETRVGEREMGAYLPDPITRLDAIWKKPLAFHSERHIDTHDLTLGLAMPWEARTSFVSFPNTAVYSPVSYVPMVVTALVARSLGAHPLFIMYACRFANAAFSVVLICFAISIAGELAPLYLGIALMPMGVFLCAMCSPDGATNAMLLVLLTLTLRAFREPLSKRALVILTCTALAVAGVKLPYPGLLLFPLMLPARSFVNRRAMIRWKALTGAACTAITGAWALAIRSVTAEVFPVSVINGELLREHPERFFVAVETTLEHDFTKYCREFIGVLGWLDTHLPPFAYYFGGLLLVASVIASNYEAGALARAAMIMLSALMALFAFLAMFVTWSAPGNPIIDGVQGRYFIPSTILFMLALTPTRCAQSARPYIAQALPFCFTIMLSIALNATWHRYYG